MHARGEAAALEQACMPPRGTRRLTVEGRLGAGLPRVMSKLPVPAPADSLLRSYSLVEGVEVLVRYDAAGLVGWAHVPDPFATKGRPLGTLEPLAQRHWEAARRLEQMRRVRAAFVARFGAGAPFPAR